MVSGCEPLPAVMCEDLLEDLRRGLAQEREQLKGALLEQLEQRWRSQEELIHRFAQGVYGRPTLNLNLKQVKGEPLHGADALVANEDGLTVATEISPTYQMGALHCEASKYVSEHSQVSPKGNFLMPSADDDDEAKEANEAPAIRRAASMSSWQLSSEHRSSFGKFLYMRYESQIEWWVHLEEPPRTGWLARLVLSSGFEWACSLVIMLNMVFLCISTDYEVAYGATPESWEAAEWAFLFSFGLEIFLKVCVHRVYFFCSKDMWWNIFDLALVVIGFAEQIARLSGGSQTLRPLRTFKLAKILRGARLMRFFTELSVMLNSLLGSLMTLFWSCVMLTLLFYLFAVIMVQGVATYLTEHGTYLLDDPANKASVDPLVLFGIERSFCSIPETMLTLYKTTFGGDDWSVYYDVISMTGTTNAVAFIVFVSLIHIAMMNILTGIFVDSALQLAQPDREVLAMKKRVENFSYAEDFRSLFDEIKKHSPDSLRNGYLTRKGFNRAVSTGRLAAHMEVLGLNLKDVNATLVFRGKDRLSADEFIESCMDLRGEATSLDLHTVLTVTKHLEMQQQKHHAATLKELEAVKGAIRRSRLAHGENPSSGYDGRFAL